MSSLELLLLHRNPATTITAPVLKLVCNVTAQCFEYPGRRDVESDRHSSRTAAVVQVYKSCHAIAVLQA
jgi:hypothetical protein